MNTIRVMINIFFYAGWIYGNFVANSVIHDGTFLTIPTAKQLFIVWVILLDVVYSLWCIAALTYHIGTRSFFRKNGYNIYIRKHASKIENDIIEREFITSWKESGLYSENVNVIMLDDEPMDSLCVGTMGFSIKMAYDDMVIEIYSPFMKSHNFIVGQMVKLYMQTAYSSTYSASVLLPNKEV